MDDLGINIAKTEDSAELVLRYEETDQPMGVTLILAGPDSQVYRAAEAKNNNQRLEKIQRGKKISAEMGEQWGLNLLVACTLGWRFTPPAVAKAGQGPKFSPAHARALYAQYPEIADQVNEFIGQRRNFRARDNG
jgi:hypothetical protein